MKKNLSEARPIFARCEGKTKAVRTVINDALYMLSRFGVPLESVSDRNLELMAMCVLAVADVQRSDAWADAKSHDGTRVLRTRDIIKYINNYFGEDISPGSYDDIRRKHLLLPVEAGIVLKSANNPNAARNSPNRSYALDPGYAAIIRQFGSKTWEESVDEHVAARGTLTEQLEKARQFETIPVTLPGGKIINFSPGEHNQLQKAVVDHFLPRYGNGSEVLYIGDAANKRLHLESEQLKALQFFELAHGELPDIIAYSAEKNWLYLIEAVHSFGPISPVRLRTLQRLTQACTAEIIYVTAFKDRAAFRKFAPKIAWETEVWLADAPDHLVHFDGERFLGPYPRTKG